MSRKLGDTIYLDFTTHRADTGAVTDADSTPTCNVFEDDNDTAILSPTVTKRTGHTGVYRVPIAATAGNGFEVGKSYNVDVTAVVNSITAKARIGAFTLDGKRVSDLNDLAQSDILSDATPFAGADVADIKSKTDNLPSDPADESLLEAAIATRASQSSVDAIKLKTDKLPPSGNRLRLIHSTDSYINCGAIYSSATKLYISFWFKLEADHVSGSSDVYLFGKYINPSNMLAIILNNHGRLNFAYNHPTAGFSLSTSQTSWEAGVWYHVYAALGQETAGGAPSDGARLRVNGGTASTSSDNTPAPASGNFLFGSVQISGGSEYQGFIKDIVVGTADNSEAMEEALYDGFVPENATDYWPIDEGTGTTLYSYGTSANNAGFGSANYWMKPIYTADREARRNALSQVTAIKEKTDLIPDDIGDIPTADELNAAHGSGSWGSRPEFKV